MKTLINCPVCQGNKFQAFLTAKDHTVSGENFSIMRCVDCDFKFTNPRPEDSRLGEYYKSDEYISHSDTRKGIVARLYHLVRKYTMRKKIQIVGGYVSRGTILDFGCGTGAFLSAAKQHGWKISGIEPDDSARSVAALRTGEKLYSGWRELEQTSKASKFSAISLWHVLEHVPDLDETIQFLNRSLLREGRLFVAVPNCESADSIYYRESWAALDVPRHLYHFQPSTMERLMERHGFDLVKMLPMRFDSFYVSLLSERYKRGKNNLLKAFLQGLSSNLKARNASQYSSVIYIFRKS